jgi:hypothetical protein
MLKICDGVDLKELEKFGFEYESILKVYYKMIISNKTSIFLFNKLPKAKVISITKKGEIITRKMEYWLEWNICKTDEKDIKDLIKAGLVEKVDE